MQVGEGELGRQGHVTEATERKGGAQTGSHPAAAKSHDPSLPRCQAEQVPPARPGHTQVSGPPENLVREPTIHRFTRHPHTPCPHMPTRLPGLDFRALQHRATSRPPGCLPGPLLDCPGPHCLCPPTARALRAAAEAWIPGSSGGPPCLRAAELTELAIPNIQAGQPGWPQLMPPGPPHTPSHSPASYRQDATRPHVHTLPGLHPDSGSLALALTLGWVGRAHPGTAVGWCPRPCLATSFPECSLGGVDGSFFSAPQPLRPIPTHPTPQAPPQAALRPGGTGTLRQASSLFRGPRARPSCGGHPLSPGSLWEPPSALHFACGCLAGRWLTPPATAPNPPLCCPPPHRGPSNLCNTNTLASFGHRLKATPRTSLPCLL